MSPRPIPVVGIIGSIGSGKSALAQGVAAQLGGLHFDADKIGHELLSDEKVVEAVRQNFGTAVLNPDGLVDRRALARRVFGDSTQQTQHRHQLEAILHPRIRAEVARRIETAAQGRKAKLILLDAAVLLEAGWEGEVDTLLCVDAPREIRLQRVLNRGWDADELARREAAQLPLDEKVRRSELMIDNSAELGATIEAACQWLMKKYPQLRSSAPENSV